jgi:hypothetical protein
MIGGERHLQEGAAAEYDQPHSAAWRLRQQLHDGFLRCLQPAASYVAGVHRPGEIEQYQHVAPGLRA